MSCYEEYAAKLKAEYDSLSKKPRLTVHLNFMEGHCAADPAEVPHLVDEKGYFKEGIKGGDLRADGAIPEGLRDALAPAV